MKIGAALKRSGKPHDGRAPDYDDWSLNGDILFWNECWSAPLSSPPWASVWTRRAWTAS